MQEEKVIIADDENHEVDIVLDDDSEVVDKKTVDNSNDDVVIPSNDDVIKSLNEKIKNAQKDLEFERNNRIKAESAVAQKDAVVTDSQYILITNALEYETAQVSRLKNAYKEALATGDVDRVSELEEELYSSRDKIKDLKAGKTYLENQAAQKKVEPTQELPSDPVEKFIAYNKMQGKNADWIRSHPDCVKDDSSIRKLQAWHTLAVDDEGLTVGTTDYYDFLDKMANRGQKIEIIEPAPTKRSIPSAPVTRSDSIGDASRKSQNTVRLTAAELAYIENSKDIGMTKEKYAKHKLMLAKQKAERGE